MLAVFLPLALAAGIATVWAPLAGLMVLIAGNPFDVPFQIGAITVYSNELLLAAVLLGYGVRLWRQRQWPGQLPVLAWALPLLAAILVSAVNAGELWSVAKQFLRWLEMILMVWFAAQTLRSERQVKWALVVLLAAGTAVAGLGVLQTLAGPDSGLNSGRTFVGMQLTSVVRAYSTFGHPNQFAGYIVLLLPLAFVQFIESGRPWTRWLACATALTLITALLFTYSRGAWIATAAVSLFLIYANFPKKIFMVGLLAAAVGTTIFVINHGVMEKANAGLVQRAASLGHQKEDSVHFRQVCAATAWKMFRQHPLIGFGAGEYGVNIRRHFDESYYAWEAINKHLHSLYWQIAVETGALGLLGFFLWMGFCLFAIARGYRIAPPGYGKQLLSACLASGAAFLIHNLFDMVTVFGRGVQFGIVLGVGLALTGIAARAAAEKQAAA